MKSGPAIRTVIAALLAGTALCAHAAPPRILDEDEPIRPANFAEVATPDLPRSITPRDRPANVSGKTNISAKKAAGPVSLWGTVAGLGIVFAMILCGRVWLTRHGPIGMRGLPVEALELLGKRTIEPRVSIHIVRCGPKVLVLGVAPDGVRTLTEITDPVEIDLIAGACRKKDSSPNLPASFAGMFQKAGPAAPTSRGVA